MSTVAKQPPFPCPTSNNRGVNNNNHHLKIGVGRFFLFIGIVVCAWWEIFPPCFPISEEEETCRRLASSSSSAATTTATRELSEVLPPPSPPVAVEVQKNEQQQPPRQAAHRLGRLISTQEVATAKAKAKATATMTTTTTAATTTEESRHWPKIEYHRKKPIFSLSLPNTGMNILPRYFKCADTGSTTHQYNKFGRRWTYIDTTKVTRKPIGECMHNNRQKEQDDILMNCGNYRVWHDLQFLRRGDGNSGSFDRDGECFDPVVFPGSLERLYSAKPNATVIVQIPDFEDWYQRLSPHLHHQWKHWCNPTHDNFFPTDNKTQKDYLTFFHRYHERIRKFVSSRPSWNLIELNFTTTTHTQIANRLQQQLGIDSQCWMDSVRGNIVSLPSSSFSGDAGDQLNSRHHHHPQDGDRSLSTNAAAAAATEAVVTNTLKRPNDITYPILTVSLPRSGTTTIHNYFTCHLGRGFSSHQFITTQRSTTIGQCIQNNTLQQEQQPLLQNCGNAYVFSDVGIINPRNGTKNACYYPQLMSSPHHHQQKQLHSNGLENFAQHYPYGTILLTVRTNVTAWVQSITKWRNLKEKWSKASKCQGIFPPPQSSTQKWIEFYHNTTQSIRRFVRHHPTLTYIEVPLTDETGSIMDDIFGFHEGCWGHANANPEHF